MQNKSFIPEIPIRLSHFPTLFLIVGYMLVWAEIFLFPKPVHFVLTTFLLLFMTGFLVKWGLGSTKNIKASLYSAVAFIESQTINIKALLYVGVFFCMIIVLVSLYAYALPIHLPQETDSLNYHLTIPRQHLLIGSFAHITWSVADLFLLPLDFALAPFSLVTPFPNKFTYFLFFLGMIVMGVRLTYRFSRGNKMAAFLGLFSILGSHIIGIQAGLAMMDLVMLYLFLATLHSFIHQQYFLAALEFTFFLWSKPFVPVQCLLLGVVLILVFSLGCVFKFELYPNINAKGLRRVGLYVLFLSVLIGGPFVVKSIYYTGSCLYPFFVHDVILNPRLDTHSSSFLAMEHAARETMSLRDAYGWGRGFINFIEHFWRIAIPDQGVNNKFDYPVGLMYLLLLGPFLFFLFKNISNKRICVLSFVVVIVWCFWWQGSQQSRFLLIPLMLLNISVLSQMRFYSSVLSTAMVLCLALTTVSLVRAHYLDWGKGYIGVLREKDKELMRLNLKGGTKVLSFCDAAYADFIFDVRAANSYFILDHI